VLAVGLIEEQDCPRCVGGIEDRAQVVFGFADIFADESGQVNTVKIEIQVAP
jgi:hypothetical protein